MADHSSRELAWRELERFEDEQAIVRRADAAPTERDHLASSRFAKDDRRSSSRLTEQERNARWPLG